MSRITLHSSHFTLRGPTCGKYCSACGAPVRGRYAFAGLQRHHDAIATTHAAPVPTTLYPVWVGGWAQRRASTKERCRRASSQTAAPGGRLSGRCGRPLEGARR